LLSRPHRPFVKERKGRGFTTCSLVMINRRKKSIAKKRREGL